MTASLPPDLPTLRAFIRGTLPPDDHRLVNRWCGRCVDPLLLDVLDGLILEWRDEQRDAAHSAGWLRTLGARFRAMLADGTAQIEAALAQPALQRLSEATVGPHIDVLEAEPGMFSIHAAYPTGALSAVLIAVRDHGDPVLLASRSVDAPGRRELPPTAWELDAADGRVTFWLLTHRQMDLSSQVVALEPRAIGEWLEGVAQLPSVHVCAARLGE